jgi:hypothetical protein
VYRYSDCMTERDNEMQKTRENRQVVRRLRQVGQRGIRATAERPVVGRSTGGSGVECEHGSGGVVCEVVCEGGAVSSKALEILQNVTAGRTGAAE